MTEESDKASVRRRAPRTEYGIQTQGMLRNWEHLVTRAERGPATHLTGCPLCDGDDGYLARDQLETLIVRGGRRGQRVAAQVAPLDDRFIRATTPEPHSPVGPGWWRHRNLD